MTVFKFRHFLIFTMDKYVLVGFASSLTVLILFSFWTLSLKLPVTLLEMIGFSAVGFSLSIVVMSSFKKERKR